MKQRIQALVAVGAYIGIEAMVAQVKEEEKNDLHRYLKKYFLNTHGMSQDEENEAWKYRQEGTEIGYKYLTALYNI